MGDNTRIEWTDATLNPIKAKRKDTGKIGWHCEKVSPACTHCYACTLNLRNLPNCGTGLDYVRASRDQVEIFLDLDTLREAWNGGKRISMSSTTEDAPCRTRPSDSTERRERGSKRSKVMWLTARFASGSGRRADY